MQTITLESLLIGEMGDNTPILEPYEAAMECADAFQECAEIEQNLTTYEAAKLIKKAKSASKKVKVTKSKMTAKNAKAKKAGGKVIKVTKESDAALDGGTGPTPTTTDTNGLTDTDLDVDPDAEVEVTEISDEQPVSQEAADWYGMVEGEDYVVEYEDASIVALEAGAKEMLGKFKDSVAGLWEKIVNFVKSVAAKVAEAFDFHKKFVEKHKAEIEKGMAAGSETVIKVVESVAKSSLDSAGNELITTVSDALLDIGGAINEGKSKEEYKAEKILMNDKDNPGVKFVEKKLSELKASYDGILKFFTNGPKEFKKIINDVQKLANEVKKMALKANKEKAADIRRAATLTNKMISKCNREFNNLRTSAWNIARAAAKAGGAKDTGDDAEKK